MNDCDQHEWAVFSTVFQDGFLLLQCVDCTLLGTVDNPTEKEWAKAFHAPSKPYRWIDSARVHVRKHTRLHVVRSEQGPHCECMERRTVNLPAAYERFPAEIGLPKISLTDEERDELVTLSGVACEGQLYSRMFPFFLQCYQQDTGVEITGAVQRVASRIEKFDAMGLHCSPSIVSRVLLEWADH